MPVLYSFLGSPYGQELVIGETDVLLSKSQPILA